MNLENLNLVELNAQEKMDILGGSWLSRQWDAVKQFVVDYIVDYATTSH